MQFNIKNKLLIINLSVILFVIITSTLLSIFISKTTINNLSKQIKTEMNNNLIEKLKKASEISLNQLEEKKKDIKKKSSILARTEELRNLLIYNTIDLEDKFIKDIKGIKIKKYKEIDINKKISRIYYSKVLNKIKNKMTDGHGDSIELFEIIDRTGRVRSKTSVLQHKFNEKDYSKNIKNVYENEDSFVDIIYQGNEFFIKAYTLISEHLGSENKGIITVSIPLDLLYVNEMKNILQTEVFLFDKNKLNVSTVSGMDFNLDKILKKLDKENILIENIELEETNYKIAYLSLENSNQERLGVLGLAIKSNELKNSLKEFNVSKEILIKKIIYVFILISIIAFILSYIFIYIFSHQAANRIKNMLNVVNDVAKGNNDVSIEIKSEDEISEMGLGINSMIKSLKKMNIIQNEFIDKIKKINRSNSRFVPEKFLKILGKESVLNVELGDQVEKEMTIMFADIRNFTVMSEKMTPKENFDFVNSFLNKMSPIISKNNGFIDKYIGDAIMALFPNNVEDALNAAKEMRLELKKYNEDREKLNKAPIEFGIGMHYGKSMLGTVGSENRMDGTVISDSVNLTSRLEYLTKSYKVKTILSSVLLDKLEENHNYSIRFLGRVKVKGKENSIEIYELLDGLDQELIDKRIMTKDKFEEAIRLYIDKKYLEALEIFNKCTFLDYEDETLNLFIEKCNKKLIK